MFLSFGLLYFGILGFKSEQYFVTLNFCIFNIYGDCRGLFVFCIRFPEIYFIEPCSASTELLRKELGGH